MTATTQAAAGAPNQASVEGMRALARQPEPDYAVDFFSAKGFELAQRLAKAFASSNGVPTPFRAVIEKRVSGGGTEYVDNPAALGNCLIAIETARAVGVSITAVMQNANVIEGRLTWSAQYKIAAINASRRFTPLRFQLQNKGRMKATYREKLGWNKAKGGFDFENKTVEVDNWECIAWALPYGMQLPNFAPEQLRQHSLLELLKAAGYPVVESAPVSMKLAVEEGWYAKPGSKWQTEMKHLMLQYRAGSFFGNIHAPDIVMGMGRTTEEMEDIVTVDMSPQGQVLNVSTETIVRPQAQPADVVQHVGQVNSTGSGEEQQPEGEQGQEAAADGQSGQAAAGTADGAAAGTTPASTAAASPLKYAEVADAITKASTPIELQAAQALIARVQPEDQQPELNGLAQRREAELNGGSAASQPRQRRTAAARTAVE